MKSGKLNELCSFFGCAFLTFFVIHLDWPKSLIPLGLLLGLMGWVMYKSNVKLKRKYEENLLIIEQKKREAEEARAQIEKGNLELA